MMYEWQKDLLKSLEGYKPGELVVMMAGRNTGKSQFSAQAFQRLWDDIYKPKPVTDLILSEGKVFGARYYCVEPEGGVWTEMEAWARDVYGEPAEVWESQNFMWPDCGRWYMNNRKFWFRDEKDRTMFILKWR